MADWFEEWFNTEEYLDVYRHRNNEEAETLIELILKNISLSPEAKVLDLACGAGRHSILFAKNGFEVTAVDLSINLLKVAKHSACEENLNIDFIHSDLRHLSLKKKFDLAVNLFTSFGYFENDNENFEVFEIAAEHLISGGYFVFDFFNKDFIINRLVPESVGTIPGGRIIQNRTIEGKRVIKRITVLKDGGEKHYHESVRLFCKNELTEALEQKGFKVKNIFGDYSGSKFISEISPRIIIIAQK